LNQNANFKAELILVLVTILAGMGWVFAKEVLVGLPPFFFIAFRFLIGGGALFLVGKKYFHGVKWADLKQASIVGVVMGVTMMFWIIGLDQGSSLGVGAFITSLGVVMVPVMARFMFGQRPPLSIWVALPFAILGLAFLALSNGVGFEMSQLYFFCAAVCVAFQLNLLARFSLSIHALVLTAIQLTVAGVFLLIVSLLTEALPSSISVDVAGWLLASGLIATSLRYLLQNYALSLTPVSHGAVIMNLEPVWAAIFAVVWFAEVMAGGQVFGCLLIFAAMLISRWPQIKLIFKHN